MDSYTPFSPKSNLESRAEPDPEIPDDLNIDDQTGSEEKQARLAYVKSVTPNYRPKSWWPRILIGAAIFIILLGVAGYFYHKNHATTKPAAAAKPVTAAQVVPSVTPSSSTLAHYVSNGSDLNLNFDYPANWSVTPASGNNPTDQTITLTSPTVSINPNGGAAVTGKVVFAIRPASASITELSSGQAAAGQNSVQIAYAKPTSAQYQYPYLTFIHLKGGSNPTGLFEEVLVSGTTQLTASQSITDTSISVDPIITASFYTCTTNACTGSGAVPLSITNATWTSGTVFQQTLAIIESLQLN